MYTCCTLIKVEIDYSKRCHASELKPPPVHILGNPLQTRATSKFGAQRPANLRWRFRPDFIMDVSDNA